MGSFVKLSPYYVDVRRKEKLEHMENLQNINILVCDDDKEIAAAVDIYLTAEGYRVIKA